MLKYITRRFKDTYEKGYNILYSRKTWTCSEKETFSGIDKCSPSSTENCKDSKDSHERNETKFDTEAYQHSWLEAVKWSSVFIIGWYSSQLAYFDCKLSCRNKVINHCSLLNKYECNFDRNIISKVAFPAPNLNQQRRSFHVYNVGYDNYQQDQRVEPSTDTVDSSTAFENASINLEKIVGQIENKLGVASLKSGDVNSGLSQLQSGAQHGNAAANFNLGLCHELGVGVKKNFEQAQSYYEEAANLGHTNAMYNLGVYYSQGRPGIQVDTNKARRLFFKAAEKGHAEAARVLQMDPIGFITMQKQINDVPLKTKGI